MVEFLHTGNVCVKNIHFAVDLLKAAQFYLMPDLISACEAHLVSRLNVGNCVDLWKAVACQQHVFLPSTCTILVAEIEKCLAKNLPKVMIEKSFLELTATEICNVLSLKPVVKSVSVDICFQTALVWLLYDPEGRRVSSDAVLDLIPLCPALITRKALINACRSSAMSQSAKQKLLDLCACYMEMNDNGEYISVPDYVDPSLSSPNSSSSSSTENLYFIGGSADINRRHFSQYNINRKEWFELEALPWTRRFCSAGVFDGDRLLVFGGEKEEDPDKADKLPDSQKCSADIDEFNLSKSKWSDIKIATLPRASSSWFACGSQQAVYLSNQGYFTTYSPQTKKFASKKSMPCSRWRHTVSYSAVLNSVFVADGCERAEGKYYPRIDRYDIASDTWQSVGFAKLKCTDRTSVLCGDEWYLIGGREERAVELDKVEVCNVRTGKVWSLPNCLSTPRPFCQAALLYDNVICVFGSCSAKSVDAYDVREGKWTTGVVVPDMLIKNEGFGLAWK